MRKIGQYLSSNGNTLFRALMQVNQETSSLLFVQGDGSEESFQEMFKDMQAGMGSCGGGGDTNGDGFMGIMQGMMQNLLSKDLLYPSLKEIEDKVHFVLQ